MGRPQANRRIKADGLPANVTGMLDRHGRYRLRFRKTGFRTHYFKSPYPSRGFWAEYDACLEGNADAEPVGAARIARGTVHDLMTQYCSVPTRLGPSQVTQYKVRQILENDFRYFVTPSGDVVGNKLVSDCTFEPLDAIIQAKAATAPWQAKKLRRHLRKLFDFARKAKMIDHNPVDDTELVAAGKSKGFHSWSEGEIDHFVKRHPLGTKPYAAMMLMLWTFQRRGDAIRMAPAHISDGFMSVYQMKGRKALDIPVSSTLKEAIDALPRPAEASPDTPFLLTEFGKPFSPKGFGNWFRRRCDEAGLPQCSAHGLRKAASRRAAELNLSNQSIKALTGHVKDDEVALYTAAASQRRLAGDAMDVLAASDLANRQKRLSK